MKAYRKKLESFNENKRYANDKRKKIAWAVFSYIAENGFEYRKSFILPAFTHENEFFKIAPLEIIVNG